MLVVIQRGHYPRRQGSTGTSGRDSDPTEQEFAVVAAGECKRQLEKAGHQVRVINADVPNESYRGDRFVAIHCDGSTAATAHGASAGYQTNEGARLAGAWKAAYARLGWSGFRPDNYTAALAGYYGVRRAVAQGNRAAIIVECGFLTNPSDERILTPPRGPDLLARSLVAAFGGAPGALRPPAPPVLAGTAPLRLGSTGAQVRQWQTILAGAGMLPASGVDGLFGAATRVATAKFQIQIGVTPADGIVGPATKAATARVLAWLAAASGNAPQPAGYPGQVQQGDHGWAVQVWQRELNKHGARLTVDGAFGDATKAAVKRLQQARRLEADGIAGPATWRAMLA